MATTNIDICSRALVMIGANPITSFNEGTDEAVAASNLYESTVQNALSMHPWTFAVGHVQLSRLEDEPDGKWDAAYQLPSSPDCLAVRTVMVNGYPIEFDRFEDNIHCDASTADEVILKGIFRVDEQFWPPYFQRYVTLVMAALLAESVAAKTDLANVMEDRAEKQFARARSMDSQGRTAVKFDTSRFITRRFRQGSYNGLRDY